MTFSGRDDVDILAKGTGAESSRDAFDDSRDVAKASSGQSGFGIPSDTDTSYRGAGVDVPGSENVDGGSSGGGSSASSATVGCIETSDFEERLFRPSEYEDFI